MATQGDLCLYLMGFRINEVASDGIFIFKNGEDLYHVCDWRNKFTDALCIQHIQNPISCMVFSSTQLNLLAKQTGPQEKFSSAKPQAPAMGLFMVRNHRRFHQLPTPISGSTLVHVGTVCSGGPLNYKGKEFFQAWKTIDHLLFKLGFSAATLRELLTVSLSL